MTRSDLTKLGRAAATRGERDVVLPADSPAWAWAYARKALDAERGRILRGVAGRGRGHPRVGRAVHWTIPEETIRELEERASREGVPVAEVARRLLRAALGE